MDINYLNERIKSIIDDEEIIEDVSLLFRSIITERSLIESNETVSNSSKRQIIIKSFDEFIKNERIIQNISEVLLEAIVNLYARPALLINDGIFENPICSILDNRLNLYRSKIETAIKSVGRIELSNCDSYEWVGTGWLVDDDIIATNRHVAKTFSYLLNKNISFRFNTRTMAKYKPFINFKKEHNSIQENKFEITKVLYLANESQPDLALLKVERSNFLSILPNHLNLELDITDKTNKDIVIIGYPAYDERNKSKEDMNRIFDRIYDVKRLQPGKLTRIIDNTCFLHDCSTLGGNSGSPVIDIESGKVLGIHYAGKYLDTNYAVPAQHINDILKNL